MRIVTMCTKYVRTATGLTDCDYCPRNITTSTTSPVQVQNLSNIIA